MLIDPENHFEINGRPIHLKQAVSKADAKSLNKGPNNAALLVKLKKGTILFPELILLDRDDKRNLKWAAKGCPVTEDNVDTKDKLESEKRASHLSEKIEKMKNPNFKVSTTRVLLKNVNKKLDEKFFKGFVKSVLASHASPKQLKTQKLLKHVKMLRDDGRDGQSKVS